MASLCAATAGSGCVLDLGGAQSLFRSPKLLLSPSGPGQGTTRRREWPLLAFLALEPERCHFFHASVPFVQGKQEAKGPLFGSSWLADLCTWPWRGVKPPQGCGSSPPGFIVKHPLRTRRVFLPEGWRLRVALTAAPANAPPHHSGGVRTGGGPVASPGTLLFFQARRRETAVTRGNCRGRGLHRRPSPPRPARAAAVASAPAPAGPARRGGRGGARERPRGAGRAA
jgi:hypothetical protein